MLFTYPTSNLLFCLQYIQTSIHYMFHEFCLLNFGISSPCSNKCLVYQDSFGIHPLGCLLKNLIPTKAKLQLYKAAILPHLIFRHLVWHFCRASDTRRLERIQERGLRAVFKDDRSSYDVLLTRAKLPTLNNRRLQDICILMYKVKNGLSPNPICELFKPHQSSYRLRQSDFSMPRFATVMYGKHSIRYLGPKLWSHLTTDERNCQSLNTFKKTIRKRDFSNFLNNERCNCCLCEF